MKEQTKAISCSHIHYINSDRSENYTWKHIQTAMNFVQHHQNVSYFATNSNIFTHYLYPNPQTYNQF